MKQALPQAFSYGYDYKKGESKAPVGAVRSPACSAAGRLNSSAMLTIKWVVIEAVTFNREALERKIEEGNSRLASRIDALEIAVRQNSADIRPVEQKLDTTADSGRVVAVEERVSALEATV